MMGFIPPENIEFRDGQPRSTTAGGVPYVTFLTRAVVPEHGEPDIGPDTKEEAWNVFNTAIADYLAQENAKTVEWRIQPNASHWGKQRWQIRARLAVTETTDGP